MRILHTIPAMDGGGADRLLYDYSVRMLDDIEFDFIVHSDKEGILEKDLKDKGCNIYHIPPLRADWKKNVFGIRDVIKNGKYDIIHVSQGYRGLVYLFWAKMLGIRVRIAHSHMAFIPESKKETFIRKVSTFLVKKLATHLFACGNDAGKWMWGEKTFNKGKVHIMTNAIDTSKFEFSEEKRNEIRKQLGLEGKFVIGNVARFSYQKNHEFLIKIFDEIRKIRSDAVLMLVGRGELEDDVRKQVNELGLTDSVLFMGVRNDVPELLNAMDVFVLPSRFEGLGMVYVEAQFNGLKSFASDIVPREADITGRVEFLPLVDELGWAKKIAECDVSRIYKGLDNTNYRIDQEAQKLKNYYFSL